MMYNTKEGMGAVAWMVAVILALAVGAAILGACSGCSTSDQKRIQDEIDKLKPDVTPTTTTTTTTTTQPAPVVPPSLQGDQTFLWKPAGESTGKLVVLIPARLLADATADDRPTVRIGEENEVEDLRAASLVAQRYQLVTAGSLGVLGPTRMDYAGVLATVRTVADQLQATLRDLSG